MKLQLLLLCVLVGAVVGPAAAANSSIPITIPAGVEVQGEDSYVCITKALPDKELKLVGVEPLAEQEVVHHILLFGACCRVGVLTQNVGSVVPGGCVCLTCCCVRAQPAMVPHTGQLLK